MIGTMVGFVGRVANLDSLHKGPAYRGFVLFESDGIIAAGYLIHLLSIVQVDWPILHASVSYIAPEFVARMRLLVITWFCTYSEALVEIRTGEALCVFYFIFYGNRIPQGLGVQILYVC